MKTEQLRKLIRQEIASLTEAPDHDAFKSLNYITKDIFKIIKNYEGKADLDAVFHSWMKGLHANLKKVGIKL